MPMPAHAPDFSAAEYANRLRRTRAAMETRAIDWLVISDPSNMAWLTGYDGWSFYVHQAVLIGPSGPPIWWGRAMDALGARRTVHMGEDHIIGYADSYVQNPDKHPMQTLAALIREQGGAQGRIGVELDNYYYSAAAHQSLTQQLSGADFVDATGLVNWQRAVKSPAEIDRIRRAAGIVEQMHRTILETARPGLPKHHLVAEIMATGIRGTDQTWGDYPAIVPLTPSGMDATAPHLTWDAKPMVPGEATFFEIAGVCRRYHAPQSRTLFLGHMPRKYAEAEKAVCEAIDAGLSVASPGKLCGDVARAFNTTLNRLGYQKEGRCGYSIGLSYPPDWGERTMSFRDTDQTELRPGMVFHFMPALWLDDGGIELTEPILITETGAECLSQLPRKVAVI